MTRHDAGHRGSLRDEIEARMGVVPSFFSIGASAEVAEQLWRHAKHSYLDSSIPQRLREELFSYLSRFCGVPYCMVRHADFLEGYGAGRDEVLQLLARPVPDAAELEHCLRTLADWPIPLEAWPEDVHSPLGRAIFACAVCVFLRREPHGLCLLELRRVLGPERLERLIAFLGFVRTAHAWTEAHPELELGSEFDELLRDRPEFRAWIARYREVVDAELGVRSGEDWSRLSSAYRVLQGSTEQLGAILEDSVNEIYLIDADTLRFTLANRGARENLGYSMEELRELTPVDIKPEFGAAQFGALLEPLRTREKGRIEFTTLHQRKDGSTYPVEVHLQLPAAGQSRHFVAIILDITERRAQEAAIARSETRARAVLETAADAILTIDESGTIQAVNAATVRLFGCAESELLGRNVSMLMPSPHAEAHDDYLERYLRTGEARIVGSSRELEARHRDGSVFPIRLSVGDETLDGARLFTGVVHDLRLQKRTEAERDENPRRLRALFQQRTSLAGICTLDGTLIEANTALLNFVGAQRSELVGRPFWQSRSWPSNPALQEQLRAGVGRAARGESVHFEATHADAQGRPARLEFSIAPVTDDEGAVDVLLIDSLDVTEARSLQEQLLQAQKMEAVGTLAGGVAHDFNNLLTSIRGSSEILLDHLEPGGRLARSASRIQRAADRASALTTRLLGFSRKQVTQRRTMDLNDAARETRDLFVLSISEDIAFEMRLCEQPLYVHADEGQMSQVLMNLVVNARDALAPGGSLTLSTERESIGGERAAALGVAPGPYVAIAVRDTGTGIPPEDLPKIFDPFFTTKEPGKGTGLGLSTALGIVREHDGALTVDSAIGVGTTFRMLLPEIEAPVSRSAHSPATAKRARPAGETVLLVEDDEIMRDLISEVLGAANYGVLSAPDPDSALEIAREHAGAIALLITDVVMPTMSGFLLAKRLRAEEPGLKVLYMSGYTEQVLADRGELGTDEPFIRKPFTNAALLETVSELIRASPGATPPAAGSG